MPPIQRGRVPGPVGRPPGLSGSVHPPRRAHGLRIRGPAGGYGPGPVLLAELAQPTADTATDAQPGAAVVQLTEPEPVFGHPAQLQEVTLPLFTGSPSVPRPGDVKQGALNNCPLAAILVAMAHATSAVLSGMITEQAATVQSRRRSDPAGQYPYQSSRLYRVQFRSGSLQTVSSMLYYAWGRVAYAHSDAGVGWMSFIEKAYAVFRGSNSYNGLNTATQVGPPPSANRVIEDLAGPPDIADLVGNRMFVHGSADVALTNQNLRQMLARADGRATIAASPAQGIPTGIGILHNHTYAVLDVNRQGRVLLRNPHGGQGASVDLSLSDFRQAFIAVLQANP
jgi:hypothetical protein